MIKNNDTHTIKINPRRTVMKILFYDTKSYDKESFEATLKKYPGIQIDYIRSDLDPRTAALADGFDAVCAFVSSNVSEATLKILHEKGVRLVLLRCAGYNNVDLEKAAAYDICVMRVPGYSPEAVAEHAMALALACNRRLYKAYNKVRENDFSLAGLMCFNFYGKIAGIIGTGRIGAAMCRICNGFGMKVIAYDVYQNESLKDFVTYVTLDELLAQSDLISLHCPLTEQTKYLINDYSISKMKDGVMIINTGRGQLIHTNALIEGLKNKKIGSAGLDVYEEESEYFYEDQSDKIIDDDTLARLLSFNNVIVTSHQAFFTREALANIASTTLQNIKDFMNHKPLENEVKA